MTGISCNAAYVSMILTLSRDTTPAYLLSTRSGVRCPSLTQRALRVKSILISQIMCPLDSLYPTGVASSSSNILKATPTSNISFAKASCHRVFPFSSSIAFASNTLDGTRSPNLCVFFLTRVLMAAIMVSLFLRV